MVSYLDSDIPSSSSLSFLSLSFSTCLPISFQHLSSPICQEKEKDDLIKKRRRQSTRRWMTRRAAQGWNLHYGLFYCLSAQFCLSSLLFCSTFPFRCFDVFIAYCVTATPISLCLVHWFFSWSAGTRPCLAFRTFLPYLVFSLILTS